MSESNPDQVSRTQARPILLGPRDALGCQRAVYNSADLNQRKPVVEIPAAIELYRERSATTYDLVLHELLNSVPGSVDVGIDPDAAAGRTARLVAAGAPLILRPRIPVDPVGGRIGSPGFIALDSASGRYYPGLILARRAYDAATARSEPVLVSDLPEMDVRTAQPHPELKRRSGADVRHRLCHYHRLLSAAGWAASEPWGALAGQDKHGQIHLSWWDLSESFEPYDAAHDHSLGIARQGRARTSAATPPTLRAIFTSACNACDWRSVCIDAEPENLSAAVGRLTREQWEFVYDTGTSTIAEFADWQSDSEHVAAFQEAFGARAQEDLDEAVAIARMRRDGRMIELRRNEPPNCPRFDREIDLDLENDADQRAYLWGLAITDRDSSPVGDSPPTPQYEAIVEFTPMDAAQEQQLTGRVVDRLHELVTEARAAGRTVGIFHYSPTEVNWLRRILADSDYAATLEEVLPYFVDQLQTIRSSLRIIGGNGLKNVAQLGPGFNWRVNDPGGSQSQAWLETARHAEPEQATRAKQKLLSYNEDDVLATWMVRQWLDREYPLVRR